MVTSAQVEQVIIRLNAAGLWTNPSTPINEIVITNQEGLLIRGASEIKFPYPDEPMIAHMKNMFDVWYHNFGTSFSASFRLGQIGIVVSESTDLNAVISALISYFKLKNSLPDSGRMRWTSVTDSEHGLINAVFWLQRAGAIVEILNENSIRVTFANHVYTMHFDKEKYASIKIEGADTGAQTLEDAVLTILAHQCKLMAVKVDHS